MKIKLLSEEFKNQHEEIEIESLSFSSKDIGSNCLYFCLAGTKADGHSFAAEAVENGAVAIVCEKRLPLDIPQLLVRNARHTLAVCAANFYFNPSREMKMIGITGTNGKTTTTYILKSILDYCSLTCGVIGTNGIVFGDKVYPPLLTTPDPIDLNRILREMADSGIRYVVMEVSAHALALNKVDGLVFDVAAFTNLSQDHLDFFEDMQSYKKAKAEFFDERHAKRAVINIDDPAGEEILRKCNIPVFTYGCYNPSDVFAIDLNMSVGGLEYVLNLFDDILDIKFNLSGKFNMYNTLCAATIAKLIDIPVKCIAGGIRTLKKIDGRFNIINTSGCSIIIDFAHTDAGLKNLLATVRELSKGKVITVFGCGGNRDKKKRPVMGRVAAQLSDYCVLTSDNPRFESPMDIIRDIEIGIREIGKNNYCMVEDRRDAIKHAVGIAGGGDIVVIAGKGSEQFQELMGTKYAYNDEEFVMELIEEKRI